MRVNTLGPAAGRAKGVEVVCGGMQVEHVLHTDEGGVYSSRSANSTETIRRSVCLSIGPGVESSERFAIAVANAIDPSDTMAPRGTAIDSFVLAVKKKTTPRK